MVLKGQVAPEVVIIAAVMLFFLLSMYLVNEHLLFQSEIARQSLQATAAASQVALAINKVASGGNGTHITFLNSVGPDIANITIFSGRSVHANYKAGGYSSSPLVTNRTSAVNGTVPINVEIYMNNTGGTIEIGAVG